MSVEAQSTGTGQRTESIWNDGAAGGDVTKGSRELVAALVSVKCAVGK